MSSLSLSTCNVCGNGQASQAGQQVATLTASQTSQKISSWEAIKFWRIPVVCFWYGSYRTVMCLLLIKRWWFMIPTLTCPTKKIASCPKETRVLSTWNNMNNINNMEFDYQLDFPWCMYNTKKDFYICWPESWAPGATWSTTRTTWNLIIILIFLQHKERFLLIEHIIPTPKTPSAKRKHVDSTFCAFPLAST